MASNKSQKKKSGGRPRSYSEVYKSSDAKTSPGNGSKPVASANSASEAVESSVAGGKKGSDSVDWQGEYGYVVKDLRKLLIVSGALFVVIIGIGLVI
ncbi:MAG: hypothetical protein HC802_20350 [Caldilineaceae bacterium]|nr:hypothetical protein [Caldilineaceae bacterium]